MQLYQTRTFGDYFQDTFSFFKNNGKHFFKNYFIINGVFLLILLVLGYFLTEFYTDFLFGGIISNDSTAVDAFINENGFIFGLIAFLFLIVGLIAGVVSYAYVPIYLKLYAVENEKNFDTNDITAVYKSNVSKLIIFLLTSILLAIPLMIVMMIVMFVLMITMIGILLLPFVLAALMLFYFMTLSEYLDGDKGIWDCFGYSWELIKLKFWPTVGAVGLFYLMAYIAQNIVIIIPYVFGVASIFSVNNDPEETASKMKVVMLIVFFLSFILGAILNNLTQLNQGLVYYSLKEENEHVNTKSIIDQIGSGA